MKAQCAATTRLMKNPVNTLRVRLQRTSARAAGWSDQTIEDVISVVATFAFLNRLVDGCGIEGTDDPAESGRWSEITLARQTDFIGLHKAASSPATSDTTGDPDYT